MTETEQKRRAEALARARTAPADEHVDSQIRDADTFMCCRKCGLVKPASGWPRPCRGWARIALRGEA